MIVQSHQLALLISGSVPGQSELTTYCRPYCMWHHTAISKCLQHYYAMFCILQTLTEHCRLTSENMSPKFEVI